MEKTKAALRLRRHKHVDKITVFIDSDFAGDPVSRKSTTRLVAQIGNHTVKSGSTLQSLTALSAGEAEFYVASLQDWYSTDHGSHTPLQDDGDEPMVDLVKGRETRRHEHRNR